ncbi:Pentafunctional AROM polypeptide [Gossypium arboreum]|uniref:Pentafunctional AROM polypeptide n=1 Tax=Gossypium arboreum TaxID=29729 RepID=A0A0B0NEN1_GOSAR|nr:Pentafunctional AROM polypeptide [Gossypium arboreum]
MALEDEYISKLPEARGSSRIITILSNYILRHTLVWEGQHARVTIQHGRAIGPCRSHGLSNTGTRPSPIPV